MKKILLLGGSAQQVIAIKTAEALGYYTVLCDYLKDNPGQYDADKFYLVSTTDRDAVLKIAKKEKVDGILAYASDPAAPVAAYVAEQMDLPSNPYRSVETLCNKDQFRALLAKHGFCTPKAKSFATIEASETDIAGFKFPLIVKPSDSSGSKGVSRINKASEIKKKFKYAMSFSRKKRIIVEEYVEKSGYQIAGDGFSIDGKLVFQYFANDHFDAACINPFVPISASFPCSIPLDIQNKVHHEIQRLISILEMKTCAYNFDVRIGKDGNVYLMEVAPRCGGNFIPQIIKYATGVDLIEVSVRAAMGEPARTLKLKPICNRGFYSYYAVHSLYDGVLKEIIIDESARKCILENHILVAPGDQVKAFTGANTTLGILLMRFESMEQMLEMMDHSEKWITILLCE